MARTADPQLRQELLDGAVDHVCAHGLTNLSLRPLADALGVTPGTLLYHFGSKEALLMEIIRAGRERQQAALEQTNDMLSLWKVWTKPSWLPIAKMFFEVYALALEDPTRFPGFAESAVDDWLRAIAPKATADARAAATLELAVFRGLLLDLCATGDRARTTAAIQRFAKLTR
ncbi:MAG TPA: TetR/AcrR family transcriptional regulator [Candidatus Aquilonibacter sp.]|nr:TetR/AcrR family transcriptional regulator [Candidatus Aquilonibacter sp.]